MSRITFGALGQTLFSKRHFPALLAVLCWCAALPPVVAAGVPVIYSTDLFHPHEDPDDHFDLACLYALREADVRGIVLDQGDCQAQRPGFKPVAQLNLLAGRNLPAAIGLRDKLKSPNDAGLDQPDEFQGGVRLMLQTLRETREKVVIVFVGSARDVVAAYNREPALFRAKVSRVFGFIGEASDASHQEWNVRLDPQAFVGLFRSELPFYWVPCFDGGTWVNRGHASYWQTYHSNLLAGTSAPLERYFLYMLKKATNDPVAYLAEPTSRTDRDWLMASPRNMWCGAILGMAVGRPLDNGEIASFAPVQAAADQNGAASYGQLPGSRQIMRFEIRDRERFAQVATAETAKLLRSFPLKPKPK